MKNFLRSLRYSFAYRNRLVLSFICALAAAAFWSLNFAAIYPVLKILTTGQNMQQWVDERLTEAQTEIDEHRKLLERDRHWHEIFVRTGRWPDERLWHEEGHKLVANITRLEDKLNSAVNRHYRFQQLKFYVIRFLPTDPFQTLCWIIVAVVVGVAVRGFFEFAQESLVGSVTNRTLFDLRNHFYRNTIHLDVAQFGEHGSSELMARFTNDTETLGAGVKTLYGRLVSEPLRAAGCVVMACYISWQLTLLFLVIVPAALVVLSKVSRAMKRASRRLLERMSNIYKHLAETFHNIRLVKGFTSEAYERYRFRQVTRDYYHRSMRVVNIDAAASPTIEVLGIASVSMALLAGAYLVLNPGKTQLFGLKMVTTPLDAEMLLQLYAYLAAIADPVRKLSSVYTKLQSGAAAADRVFSAFDRRPEITPNTSGVRLPRLRREIEFRDVCFSYVPGQPVLRHIDLTVAAGEVVALVGKNGCGKSTLLNLLPRFLDPDHGSVLLDGVDLRRATLRSLRRQIALVTQETLLFDDTILANIAYGNRRATREQIEAAARQALAHDFIAELPQGYETRVGEAGRLLSGGQKQRIALARAVVRDPSILILDEFTSQNDAESEADIHQELKAFVRGRTAFVITHRLNTLQIADRIVVLDAGRIAAVGTHDELMRTCAIYQRLHDAHFQRMVA